MKKTFVLVVLALLSLLCGCGSGGGGIAVPSRAVLKISADGMLAPGVAVSGFGATIELPAGVTVKTDELGTVDAAVVVPSGLMAGKAVKGPVIFTPATATTKAKLDISLVSLEPSGVGVGEYVTINCKFHGDRPAAADFEVSSFTPVDMHFNPLALTAITTLSIR